ncbi:MAG TPA: hypothetical protein PL131_11255 [Methylotenera sp.]|nr:hypothetical protein [Methylotenera sp.]HPH06444.1 hypothetical protein [Methylotenera sp.]HPN00409.1 hypothetical protein [Methylotenera sp.]
MKTKKRNAEQSNSIVGLLLLATLLFFSGCAQVANQKSNGSKYGQPNAARWKALETLPVVTPSEAPKKISITVMGQSFRYLDDYLSFPSQKPNSEQLNRNLKALGHNQSASTQFSNTALDKVFKFTQQREGMLVFHCVGDCANVEINVSGDFYASLGMKSQFPAVWFKSPTLYRHTISVRISNPDVVAKQQFNLQVSLWDSV